MAERDEPIDPSLIQNFTDLDTADKRIMKIFLDKHPDLQFMVINRVIDDEENVVHYEISVCLPDGKGVTYSSTVPLFRVRPINQGEFNA